jgi:hypothetical protein
VVAIPLPAERRLLLELIGASAAALSAAPATGLEPPAFCQHSRHVPVRLRRVWVSGRGEETRINGTHSVRSAAVSERSECTAQGYRRFRCRTCGKQVNERSAGSLNRTRHRPRGTLALAADSALQTYRLHQPLYRTASNLAARRICRQILRAP